MTYGRVIHLREAAVARGRVPAQGLVAGGDVLVAGGGAEHAGGVAVDAGLEAGGRGEAAGEV